MSLRKTRFILTLTAMIMLFALALLAIIKGDNVTPPLCVTAIGGLGGYYTYGKTKNNDTYMQTQKPES